MNTLMVYVVAIFLEAIPAFCIGMAMGWKIGCREADEDDYYHEYRHDQRNGGFPIGSGPFDFRSPMGRPVAGDSHRGAEAETES